MEYTMMTVSPIVAIFAGLWYGFGAVISFRGLRAKPMTASRARELTRKSL